MIESPINFAAFSNAEPLVLAWMILMLMLCIYLPVHLALKWLRRPRRKPPPSLLD